MGAALTACCESHRFQLSDMLNTASRYRCGGGDRRRYGISCTPCGGARGDAARSDLWAHLLSQGVEWYYHHPRSGSATADHILVAFSIRGWMYQGVCCLSQMTSDVAAYDRPAYDLPNMQDTVHRTSRWGCVGGCTVRLSDGRRRFLRRLPRE